MADAAAVIQTQPTAIQLRYLQTLTELATERTSTVLFPLPIDLVAPLLDLRRPGRAAEEEEEAATPPGEPH